MNNIEVVLENHDTTAALVLHTSAAMSVCLLDELPLVVTWLGRLLKALDSLGRTVS